MLVIPCIGACNSQNETLREEAAKFLWNLIQLNDAHRGTFLQVKLACTIAISRLVTQKAGETFRLKQSLDQVVKLAAPQEVRLCAQRQRLSMPPTRPSAKRLKKCKRLKACPNGPLT